MSTRLYVVPGSHPSLAARLMLDHKRVEYRRVDLIPVVHKATVRVLGFPGATVPALKIDGERIQGTRKISRALDRLVPERPLFPADPERRAAVEDAERYGDEEMQKPLRRIAFWCLKRNREPMRELADDAHLRVPTGLAMMGSGLMIGAVYRIFDVSDETVRRDLEALPAMLDRVDAYIADGTIGGEVPNAADFQIAANLALPIRAADLRPAIEARPAGTLDRLVTDYPGEVPSVLPPAWLEPLRTR